MVEYHHVLARHMVIALRRLYNAGGGPINIRELNLPWAMRDNFQKLRYFDLVTKSYSESGVRALGVWEATVKGREFITNRRLCEEGVWTYRGERQRYDGALVSVDQVVADYQQRPEWAIESKSHFTTEDEE